MASDHETIAYEAGKLTELLDTTVLTGTIVSVDTANDTASVNIDGTQYNDVPIFYHCADSETVEGGSVAFSEDDSVYVLNKEGNLTITGFVDGLKSCGWSFKLYRDDDTTERDAEGNITTPSGLLIELFQINYIKLYGYYDGEIDYWSALPGNYGWASAYWTFDSETGIWNYDDTDPDYLEWAWKGTYNTNTGWFTIEQHPSQESDDGLYWIEYECAKLTTAYGSNPDEDAAVSSYNIDRYIGVKITLTKAGNSQTLADPTYKTAGRKFTVKASETNASFTVPVNGIILSAGESQCFEWSGTVWEAISVSNITYSIDTQYPYFYKNSEKDIDSNRISTGSYTSNIPYFEISDFYYSPIPIYESLDCVSLYCDGYNGFTIDTTQGCFYFYDTIEIKRHLKTSIPFYKKYFIRDTGIGGRGYCNPIYPCAVLVPKAGTANILESITHISSDSILDITQEDTPITVYSEEQITPGSIEIENEMLVFMSNTKFDGWGFWSDPDPPPGSTYYCGLDGEAELIYRRCVFHIRYINALSFEYEI